VHLCVLQLGLTPSSVCCSHNVAAKGKYIAFVSTTVETDSPEMELSPGLTVLGPVDEKFVYVSDVYAPAEDGSKDQCFISKGYDATSHFESTIDDVLEMYTRITGESLDVTSPIVDKLEDA
jgi:Rab GDP dissociation inhibitor